MIVRSVVSGAAAPEPLPREGIARPPGATAGVVGRGGRCPRLDARGRMRSGCAVVLSLGMGQPVGIGAGLDDGAAEGEPVDDRSAKARVGEGLGPAIWGSYLFVLRDLGLCLGSFVLPRFTDCQSVDTLC